MECQEMRALCKDCGSSRQNSSVHSCRRNWCNLNISSSQNSPQSVALFFSLRRLIPSKFSRRSIFTALQSSFSPVLFSICYRSVTTSNWDMLLFFIVTIALFNWWLPHDHDLKDSYSYRRCQMSFRNLRLVWSPLSAPVWMLRGRKCGPVCFHVPRKRPRGSTRRLWGVPGMAP